MEFVLGGDAVPKCRQGMARGLCRKVPEGLLREKSMALSLNISTGMIEGPAGDPVSLTRAERIVLELLSTRPHRVVTREQLLDAVSEPGSDKNDRNVDFLINRLRRKLSDDARQPRFIATRYGEGYVWIAEAPQDLQQIANADIVVGPVRGLELVTDIEAAKEIARSLSTALTEAFGSGKRIVHAPDCPPSDEFGRQAPRHAVEVSFFSDRGRTDCIISARDFRAGHVIFARRMGLHRIAAGEVELERLAAEIRDALWLSGIASPSRAEALPIALMQAAHPSSGPENEPDTASHRKLLSRHDELETHNLSRWQANDVRLRGLLAQSPDDPELKLLIAVNTHSKYVTSGVKLFMSGHNTREMDEDEIEDFVTSALPAIRNDPEYAIVAAKMLYFLKRGYDELARDLCEGAYAQSLSVDRSLAIIGQMRAYFGETDAALQCLEQALNLATPGSHSHLYALIIKCQILSASRRLEALESAMRELAGANRIAGFVLEPMFGNPDTPSLQSRALSFLLRRERARAMLMHKYYTSARLFRDPEQGLNAMRSLARVLTARFGQDVIPDEVRVSFPGLVRA